MANDLQNFVGGQWTDLSFDKRADIIDPSTGEVFATAPISGEAEVDAAFALGGRRLPRLAGRDARPSAAWRCCGSRMRSRPGPTSS